MPSIVFAHKNFPAQFGAFGEWLAQRGWTVAFITQREGVRHHLMRVVRCADKRSTADATHAYVRGFERAVITGQAFAGAALDLQRSGFKPDVVMAHAGWGAGAFLKDVWPAVPYVPYFEWYYSWPIVDTTPYDRPVERVNGSAFARARNAPIWTDFSAADAALCPTRFQADRFPAPYRDRLTIQHDGIDTELHSPGDRDPDLLARFGVPGDAEVVTSITRGMEPHRGFPDIMRALAVLQQRRPKLHALIGGEDRVVYGAALPEGESWKQRMLAELDLDLSRVHFTGLLSRKDMVGLMRASGAHLYLTVPFVLSWSLLDAMSTGALIVASDTEPVREFMTDGESGFLCPMHDVDALVRRTEDALDAGADLQPVRARARAAIVDHLDADSVVWPAKEAWLRGLI